MRRVAAQKEELRQNGSGWLVDAVGLQRPLASISCHGALLRVTRGVDYVQPKRPSEHLDKWCKLANHAKLAPFFTMLAKTVRRHEDRILAYVETGLSNGGGINNKIRAIIRCTHGFRKLESLEAMILLCHGGMEFTLSLPVGAQ